MFICTCILLCSVDLEQCFNFNYMNLSWILILLAIFFNLKSYLKKCFVHSSNMWSCKGCKTLCVWPSYWGRKPIPSVSLRPSDKITWQGWLGYLRWCLVKTAKGVENGKKNHHKTMFYFNVLKLFPPNILSLEVYMCQV